MMDNETKLLLIKSLERYKARLLEVESTEWYEDKSVTQNEIPRIDRALTDLNSQQQIMSEPLWRDLFKEDKLEELYEVLRRRGTFGDKEIAIHLAHWAEAHVFNAADRHIIESEKRIAELEALLSIPTAVFQDLWCGLDELDESFGKSARIEVARVWLQALMALKETMP